MVSHVSPWRLFWPAVTKLVIGFSISVWLASGEEQCGQEGQGFIQLQRHTHKYNYTSEQGPCVPENLVSNLLESTGIPGQIRSWLSSKTGGDFVSGLINEKVKAADDLIDPSAVINTGANIKARSELCARLPLKPEKCFVSPDADRWTEDLSAPDGIPFKDALTAVLAVANDAAAALEGTCLAINEEMIGVIDEEGWPSAAQYKICLCSGGCTLQVTFKGFAMSKLGEAALLADPGEIDVYDGFIRQKLNRVFDMWVALDVVWGLPALSKDPCSEMANVKLVADIFLAYSKRPGQESAFELQVRARNVTIQVPEILDESTLADTGAGVIRLQSTEPDCRPSGFFASLENKGLQLNFKEGVAPFLKDLKLAAKLDFGLTIKDGKTPPFTSFFFRVTIEDLDFLGISAKSAQFEMQVVSKDEMERRQRFMNIKSVCCGSDECDTTLSPLAQYLQNRVQDGKPAADTVAIFFTVKDFNIFNLFQFKNIYAHIIFEIPEFKWEIALALDVTAIGFPIAGIRGSLTMAGIGLPGFGGIVEEATVDVTATIPLDPLGGGVLGKAPVRLIAKASIAGWNLNTDKWSFRLILPKPQDLIGQVAGKVEGLVKKAVKEAENFVKGIVQKVGEVWEEVKGILQNWGDEFKKVIKDLVASALEIGRSVVDLMEDLWKIFKGVDDVGDIVTLPGDVLKAIRDTTKEIADAFADINTFKEKVANIREEVFKSFSKAEDYLKSIGQAIEDAATEVDVDTDGLGKDPLFGCDYHQVRTRLSVNQPFGDPIKGDWKYQGEKFPDPVCLQDKLEELGRVQAEVEQEHRCNEKVTDSEMNSKGLDWAAGLSKTDLLNELQPQLEDGTFEIIVPEGSSAPPKYELQMKGRIGKLSEIKAEVTGDVSGFGTLEVEIGNAESLTRDLRKLAAKTAEELVRAAVGTQGQIPDAEQCRATCTPATLELKAGSQGRAMLDCQESSESVDYAGLFANEVNINIDGKCGDTPPSLQCEQTSLSGDSCTPTEVALDCFVVDCCGVQSNIIEVVVVINKLPPKFTTPPGSLDVNRPCTDNISPAVLGKPDVVAGCPDSVLDLQIVDEKNFDPQACRTTVTRTFTVTENNCVDLSDTFVQIIVLEHKDPPIFDSFPSDMQTDVFDAYGTDAAGFPTSYSSCSNPVTIDYVDVMKEGSCFAERVIERTFTSRDQCGKATSQTQRITIGTPPERLPLGPKSSYWLYGELLVLRSRRFLDYLRSRRRSCIVSAALCGGPAAEEHCSFNSNEFTTYETFLSELGDLDVGALRKECRCPTRDPSCEVLPNPTNGLDFGPRIIKSFGVCQVLEEQKLGVNLGMVKRQSVQCAEGPCPGVLLSGSNAVYNIFSLKATTLVSKTVVISSPATSIVLVNLKGSLNERVDEGVQGILLEKVPSRHVLVNAPEALTLRMRKRLDRSPYHFHGTLLNRHGDLRITGSARTWTTWHGQVYANTLRARNLDFQCAHFAGFASCESWESGVALMTHEANVTRAAVVSE